MLRKRIITGNFQMYLQLILCTFFYKHQKRKIFTVMRTIFIYNFFFLGILQCGTLFMTRSKFSLNLSIGCKSTHNRCGKCGKYQIFGTFATPNTKNTSHQMLYMCQNYTISVRTVANLQRYGHKW